jgi:hypothetical protein
MLKDASHSTELAMYCLLIIIPFLAVGHGGESKFTRWKSCFWDLFLKAFVSNWLQTKTMEEDQMPITSDKELFSCDIQHALASSSLYVMAFIGIPMKVTRNFKRHKFYLSNFTQTSR